MRNNISNKTKSIIIGMIIALFSSGHIVAQGMPVYDNTNFVSLVKSLVESAKQTANLVKTVNFLKAQKENIEKVNNVIRDLKAVRAIGRNNQRLIAVMQNELRDILNSPYIRPEEVNRVTESFNAVVDNSLEALDLIDKILTSDYFKMSDAERAEVLKQKELESKEMVTDVQLKIKRYQEIISFREMQDRINNRETNY
ncbi:conjugal transfer protein [Salegentibacter agarivorans]